MKYTVEMSSGAMMYIPRFIKIGSGIQTLIWGETQRGDLISLLVFFQNKESRLKMSLKLQCRFFYGQYSTQMQCNEMRKLFQYMIISNRLCSDR
jgi:hypothetical protein